MPGKLIGIIAAAVLFAAFSNICAQDKSKAKPEAKSEAKPAVTGNILDREAQVRQEYLDGLRKEMQKHRDAAHAHIKMQEAENEAFKATLEGKNAQEKEALIKLHTNQQTSENKEFFEKLHNEIQQYVKSKREEIVSRINACDATAEAKAAKIKELQERWAKNDSHYATQREENKAAIEKASADGIITKDEKEKFKDQLKIQHKENLEQIKKANTTNTSTTP
jgi:hypothetical protein